MTNTAALKTVLACSMETSMGILEPLLPDIAALGDAVTECFLGNGTLHIYSQSGLADYASTLLLHNPDRERPELPALALPAQDPVRHFRAHARAGDALLLLDDSAQARSLEPVGNTAALRSTAAERELRIFEVSDKPGLESEGPDLHLALGTTSYQQRQEALLAMVHCLVAHCEFKLFG